MNYYAVIKQGNRQAIVLVDHSQSSVLQTPIGEIPVKWTHVPTGETYPLSAKGDSAVMARLGTLNTVENIRELNS